MSKKGLKELSKQGVLGVENKYIEVCGKCVLGKSLSVKFRNTTHKSKGTLEYIHSHLWGLAQTTSLGGDRFFMSLINDYFRMV